MDKVFEVTTSYSSCFDVEKSRLMNYPRSDETFVQYVYVEKFVL